MKKMTATLDFEQRLRQYRPLIEGYFWQLYEKNERNETLLQQLFAAMRRSFETRKPTLRELDRQRLAKPDWYLASDMIGVTLYVDLFAETLDGVREKIMYFKELGITYIHLLPIFKTRPGQDDGGYAVSSFVDVHERLGTMADLERLIDELHEHGISICLDFIMNHTAKEHEWALRARAGEQEYMDMYFMYDSYDIPAEFEKTLPDIFPDTAPGNFTYYEDIDKWVFTTFYEFQWDLNYKNPLTLIRIIEQILYLTNVGVDVFRIDAIRHIWKEIGTDCSSLPQTYVITDMLKACVYVTSAGVLFLGEATTTLDEVIKYMGTEDKGCQLMYNVSFLTAVWNSLATEDARYMRDLIKGSPQLPSGTCWKNYLRCHDDLGFVMDGRFAAPLGMNHVFQETMLVSFYKGDLPASFSAGELYCFDPKTRVSRVSGTLASFCGLEKAVAAENPYMVDESIERMMLIYSMLFAYEGLPLLYAGDEIGQLNDYSYKNDADKQPDTRWLHRFPYRWDDWQKRHNATTVEGKVFQRLQKMIAVRKQESMFGAAVRSEPFDCGVSTVYAAMKGDLLILANFSYDYQVLAADVLSQQLSQAGGGVAAPRTVLRDLLSGAVIDLAGGDVQLKPYQFLWLK
jgi:amylosucrase